MLKSFKAGNFTYKKLTLDEQKKRGILGRLVGVIADTVNPTRNDRAYSEKLWQHVFEDDIVKEKIANRCFFSELGHPAEREEVDPEKICACMAEEPQKGPDGKLYGVFDILDTPNGRILKTLCDYGTTIGVSSRGTGDIIENSDGDEVDPETYTCECWDMVIVPAVKSARLQTVNEALDVKKRNKTLRQKLTENIEAEDNKDKKDAMLETLTSMGIHLNEEDETISEKSENDCAKFNEADETEEKEIINVSPANVNDFANNEHGTLYYTDKDGNKKSMKGLAEEAIKELVDRGAKFTFEPEYKVEESKDSDDENREDIFEDDTAKDMEADNVGDNSVVEELQEALLKNRELEKDNLSLQEKLSVCNAKVKAIEEELKKYKASTASLSETIKEVKDFNGRLKESVERKDEIIKANKKAAEQLAADKNKLVESKESKNKALVEKLNTKVENLSKKLDETNKQLKTSNSKVEDYKKKLAKSKEIVIESKAQAYGLTKEDVLSNLNGSSFKLSELDAVCRKLAEQKRIISKMPFRLTETGATKVAAKKSTEYIGDMKAFDADDDEISDTLLSFLNN